MISSLEFNHYAMLLNGFSNSSLDTDSIQIHPNECLLGFFLCFLHFLFQFLLDFLFRKDREHFQNSISSLETEQTKSKAHKALAGSHRNYPRSLIASSTAQQQSPPLLTWQAKTLPVRSVPRVTTRSLPSRMIDPTLLHFMRRYKERRSRTLV